MIKGRLLLFATLAAGLLGAGSVVADTLPIRIGAANATDHAAAFIGVERGIFAKHGLDAKIVMYQTGVEMINGLVNDAQDVNIMGSIPFLAAVSNGLPIVVIGHLHGDATRMHYADNNSIVTTPASGIAEGDLAALVGKKVGLPRGTGAEGYLLGVLTEAGLDVNELTLVNLKPSDQPTALRQGDVDAIAAWEPWASTTVVKVPDAFRVVSGGCEPCYDPGTILTTRAKVTSKEEELKRFMVAFAEAQQWLRANYDEAAEINMRWIQGVEIDIMKEAIRRSVYDSRLSRNTIEGYDTKTIPQLVGDKRMAREVEASTIVEPRFYKHVEATAPELYGDLPEIQADRRL
jgi:sulfonate transport system substrate-binding protein